MDKDFLNEQGRVEQPVCRTCGTKKKHRKEVAETCEQCKDYNWVNAMI